MSLPFLESVNAARVSRWVAIVATLAAAVAVVSTYRVFSSVFDEPAHISAGLEWLSTPHYRFETQHPPLGRIAAAIGPYLDGERTDTTNSMWQDGGRILGVREHFVRTLALARMGELPFFFVLCWVTWAWAKRATSDVGAAIAVVLVATNPNLLAHAGFATTDIGAATSYPVAMLAALSWLERPSLRTSVLAGAGIAFALLTRFSAIAFLGIGLPLLLVAWIATRDDWRRTLLGGRPVATMFAVLMASFALVIWATYGFSVGRVGAFVLPAPEFFQGIAIFLSHGTGGHPSFLFGKISMTGWWYYFPVVLLVKTPIPLLVLGVVGAMALARQWTRDRDVAAAAILIGFAAVLVVGMLTKVNIGVRHILALYPFLAVAGGAGAIALWRQRTLGRAAAVGLLGVALAVPVQSHPDYVAYFNAFAGNHPETILSDSNIDWGQDLYRLGDEVRRLHMDTLRFAYFGSVWPASAGVPNTIPLMPGQRPTGWVAASETSLAGLWGDTSYNWLATQRPLGRVGKSILVYYLKPDSARRTGR